ncbi:hypothetical protein MPSEU_000508400 [Mayamaea pseudoterrestris]|nr:hypothetical protein MPSEU_000508400 [Mayamaea pseudoterrestris]
MSTPTSSSPAALNLPKSSLRKSAASTVSGDGGEIYVRADGKKVRRVVKRVMRPKSVVGNESVGASATGGNGNNSNNSAATMATAATSSSSVNSNTVTEQRVNHAAAAAVESNTANTFTRPKTLGGFLDLVSGSKKPKAGGASKSVAGDFAKPFVAGPVTNKPGAAASINQHHEEYEIYVRPDGKKVRRVKRTIVKSRSGRNLLADAEANESPENDLNSFLQTSQNADTTQPTTSTAPTPKKTSAATVSGAPLSSAGLGEIYVNAQGKKVRRVVKRPPAPQTSQSTSGLAAMQQAVNTHGVGSNTASATNSNANETNDANAAAETETATTTTPAAPEYEVYRRADGKLVRRLKKPAGTSLNNMLTSGGGRTGAATVGGERVLGPGQEIREEVEIYIRPDGKKVRRVKKVIVKKKDASATVVPNEPAKESLPPTPTPPPPAMTTKAELDALLEASASKPPPKTGAASIAVVPTSGEIYINSDGKKVRRVKRATGTVAKAGSTDLGMLATAARPAGAGAAATVAGDQPSKKVTADNAADGEIYIRADGKKVRRVKKTKAAAAVGLVTDKAQLTQMLEQPAKQKSGAATVAGGQISDGEIIIRADGKKVLRRKKTSVAAEQDGTEVYRRADGKLVRRVKRVVTSAGDGNPGSALDQKLGADADNRPKLTEAATVGGNIQPPSRLSVSDSIPSVVNESNAVKPEADSASASYDEIDTKLSVTAPQAVDHPADIQQSAANVVATANPFALGAGRAPATPSWMKKRTPATEETCNPEATTSAETDSSSPVSRWPPSTTKLDSSSAPSEPDETKDTTIESTPDKPSFEAEPIKLTDDAGLSEDDEALAQFYRKKLKLGMSKEIVRHKMLQDGVAENVIFAVCGGSSVVEPAALTPARAPIPVVTTIESGLDEDEEALAQFYQKKIKMGMPLDAVRHKMMQDDIANKVINAVCGNVDSPAQMSTTASEPVPPPSSTVSGDELGLTEDDEALAQFYRKKIKMGMPQDAVRHKMAQDGVDEHVIAAVCGARVSTQEPVPAPTPIPAPLPVPSSLQDLTEDEEALAQFYCKKIKMGMPADAVRHKMMQDGVDNKVIAAVCGGTGEQHVVAAAAAHDSSLERLPASSTLLTEDEEALAQFYRKKIKMGMPIDAVRHKMLQEEVAANVVAAVCDEASVSAVSTQTQQEPVTPISPPQNPAPSQPMSADPAPTSVAYVVVVSDDPNLKLDKTPATPKGSLANLPKGPKTRVASDERSMFSVLPTEKFEVKVSNGEPTSGDAEATTKYMTLDELSKLSGQSKTELEAMVVQKRENAEEPPKFVLQPQDMQPGEVLYPVSMMKRDGGTNSGSGPTPAGSRAVNVPDGVSVPTIKPGEHLASIREDQEVVSTSLATAARAIAPLGDDITALLEKLQMGEMGALMQKLQEAEKRQKKLEKQLAGAGIQIAEDIDYSEALAKVGTIAKRMNEIGGSDVVREDKEEQNKLREEYFKLEQEMERYNTALMISEEYQAEQDRKEKEWEAENAPKNLEALKMIRRHMPVNIRSMSEAELTGNPSPNGKFLPAAIAKKFKRTNVLQILRLNPDDIERMHPSTLENMRVTGLTLTERRALYSHLRVLGPRWEKNKAEKMSERKWTWYQMMKNNFKENLAPFDRHIAQYGPPDNHPYATRENPDVGCPLIGKQCPCKADLMPDYRSDYGWTDAAEYEISNVTKSDADDPGAKAMAEARELAREKKANERADLLKKHYKGKLLQVSKANGSCESMDEAMDKMEHALIRWIEFKIDNGGPNQSDADKTKEIANFTETINEIKLMTLDFAQRSGMQTSGKKKAGGDKPDIRSSVEASLSEEVIELTQQFFTFIRMRMKDLAIYDTRIAKTIELLEGMFNELHDKNLEVLVNLQAKRSDRSRKLRTIADIEKEVEEKRKSAADEAADDSPSSPPPPGIPAGAPGRGGLLDGIKGRGGGRGGLLDGIKGRGQGGRGGLLDGIKGRGQAGGGRGGLMDAIQGRGRGGGGPPGRGGLLDAIKGRGGGDAGGRGGLMAAIAARGGG